MTACLLFLAGLGWQDLRTITKCLTTEAEQDWTIAPNQSITKIASILSGLSGAPERSLCSGTIDSWLVSNLSGGATHVSDATNMSTTTTGLRIADGSDCDRERLAAFGIDRQASLIGQGCVGVASAKLTPGTGGMLDPVTGGVVDVPALLGLGTPFWDSGARGTLLGLTRRDRASTRGASRPRRRRPSQCRHHRRCERRRERADRVTSTRWRHVTEPDGRPIARRARWSDAVRRCGSGHPELSPSTSDHDRTKPVFPTVDALQSPTSSSIVRTALA